MLVGIKRLKIDYKCYLMLKYVPRIRNVRAFWYWGPTRVGKSWKAIMDLGYDPNVDLTGICFKTS